MRIILVNEDPDRWESLRRIARGVGLECAGGDCIGVGSVRDRLTRRPKADLVLVAGDDPERIGEAVALAAAAAAAAPVFAVGPGGDPGEKCRSRAIETGAAEYWNEAALREGLSRAVGQLRVAGQMNGGYGRTIAVTSVSPGSGVTTIATGLAFSLAEEHPARTLLAEFGTGVPELALDLDLQVEHPVPYLVEGWERADASMVRQAAVSHPAGVNVLAYAEETLRPLPVSVEAARHLVGLFRAVADFAVLDLGAMITSATRAVMSAADDVVVVTRLTVPALRLTNAYLRGLRDADIPMENVTLVANRYGEAGHFSWREAEKRLRLPVAEWVPDDPARVNKARNLGQPVSQGGRCALTRSFANIVKRLKEKSQEPGNKSQENPKIKI